MPGRRLGKVCRKLWVLLLVSAALPLGAGSTDTGCVEVERVIPLPSALVGSEDVVWEQADRLLLVSPMSGLFRVPLEAPETFTRVVSGGRRAMESEIWLPRRITSDGEDRVIASPVHVLTRQLVDTGEVAGQIPFDGPMALDLEDGSLVVLGFLRDDQGRPDTGDAIAWIGSLADDFAQRKPLLHSVAGGGVERMSRCAVLGAGQIRFAADGNVVIVPGVEPGAFLVDPEGRLLQAWQSRELGFDSDCRLSPGEEVQVRTGEDARWAWLNRHRVVDEILPLSAGPAFLVRTRERSETRWDLIRTEGGEVVATCRLPFRSGSDRTRLSSDLRGERLVFLIATPGAPQDRGPALETKLIIARLPDPERREGQDPVSSSGTR